MSEIDLEINNRPYRMACEDGQESHLRALAKKLDGHIRELSGQLGAVGEGRLLLMAGLMIADEVHDQKAKITALEKQLAEVKVSAGAAEARVEAMGENAGRGQQGLYDENVEAVVSDMLNKAADRLEGLAAKVDEKAA